MCCKLFGDTDNAAEPNFNGRLNGRTGSNFFLVTNCIHLLEEGKEEEVHVADLVEGVQNKQNEL